MGRRFNRFTKRGLILTSLALVALALLAVPAAYAALATTPVTVVSKTEGAYYGGVKPLQCQVAVRNLAVSDPNAANYYYADKTVSPTTGIFVLVADLPLPTYTNFRAIATGYGPSGAWSNFFTASTQTFTPSYNSSGDFGLASLAFRLNVKNTTVSGKVTNARTGKPMAGVSVRLGNHYAQTSRYGWYTISAALWPATDYRISFMKRDFWTASTMLLSHPGSLARLSVSMRSR